MHERRGTASERTEVVTALSVSTFFFRDTDGEPLDNRCRRVAQSV